VKIKQIGSNMTLATLNHASVLYSYETPVAAFVPLRGYVRTATKWSRTTTKHINKWLGGNVAEVIPQEQIENLLIPAN
jgi:hypothetical protein